MVAAAGGQLGVLQLGRQPHVAVVAGAGLAGLEGLLPVDAPLGGHPVTAVHVDDAVAGQLPQPEVERHVPVRQEPVQPLVRLQQHVLHHVAGVHAALHLAVQPHPHQPFQAAAVLVHQGVAGVVPLRAGVPLRVGQQALGLVGVGPHGGRAEGGGAKAEGGDPGGPRPHAASHPGRRPTRAAAQCSGPPRPFAPAARRPRGPSPPRPVAPAAPRSAAPRSARVPARCSAAPPARPPRLPRAGRARRRGGRVSGEPPAADDLSGDRIELARGPFTIADSTLSGNAADADGNGADAGEGLFVLDRADGLRMSIGGVHRGTFAPPAGRISIFAGGGDDWYEFQETAATGSRRLGGMGRGR